MNIGIIVYSKTGNTLSVAERIKDVLVKMDNRVKLERFSVETEGSHPNKIVHLLSMPDPAGYDLLIFGAPVQAFSLDPAMKQYLHELDKFSTVPTGFFITQQLPKAWMGGNQASRQLTALLQEKGVTATNMGIVNWSTAKKEKQISQIVENCQKMVNEIQ